MHALSNTLYEKHTSFASNPLLLSMMLLTYDEHSNIPEQLTDFYEQAFLTLFNIHDTRKNFIREIHSKLEYGPFKAVFANFCFKTYYNGQFKFSEALLLDYLNKIKTSTGIDFSVQGYCYDLKNLVCMIVNEGVHLRFIHRSFQEYFAAVHTITLSDNIQKRILRPLLDGTRRYREYLQLLENLECERYRQNLILPVFRDIKRQYDKNQQSITWIITKLFSGISLHLEPDSNKNDIWLGWRSTSTAYNEVVHYLARKQGYVKRIRPEREKACDELTDYMKRNSISELSFLKAEKVGMLNTVFAASSWVNDWFGDALAAYEQYERKNLKKQKNIKDLINEL